MLELTDTDLDRSLAENPALEGTASISRGDACPPV
jgi:hypothetical protein